MRGENKKNSDITVSCPTRLFRFPLLCDVIIVAVALKTYLFGTTCVYYIYVCNILCIHYIFTPNSIDKALWL